MLASVRKAAEQENWYAALGMALTLPDIAGKVDEPAARSNARYVRWCSTYFEPRYMNCQTGVTWLSGGDVYALRCAFLHEGSSDTSRQRARQAYGRFRFIYPPKSGMVVHCNRVNDHLQLQVDLFCEDMCIATKSWLEQAESDRTRRRRLDQQMRIERLELGFRM